MRALRHFKDAGGRDRRTGEEWLVTLADREAHVPAVAEEVVGMVGWSRALWAPTRHNVCYTRPYILDCGRVGEFV